MQISHLEYHLDVPSNVEFVVEFCVWAWKMMKMKWDVEGLRKVEKLKKNYSYP